MSAHFLLDRFPPKNSLEIMDPLKRKGFYKLLPGELLIAMAETKWVSRGLNCLQGGLLPVIHGVKYPCK